MIDILRIPDDTKIIVTGNENIDASVSFEIENRELNIFLTANKSKPEFICLRWNYFTDEEVKVMGDKWERAYGDITWGSLNGEKFMPWYFLCDNGSNVVGCGVKVRPNSFVSFEYDSSGVCAWFDVRCGATGVCLNSRKLSVATVVCEKYSNMTAFEAAKEFCKVMCDDPILPKTPVYGGNNWYYAYGNSSFEDIVDDAKFIAEMAKENDNPPYMVIDDGWAKYHLSGPWIPNEKFGDMKKTADEIKKLGVKPGIWMRPLRNIELQKMHPEYCSSITVDGENLLDPSHPAVKEYLMRSISEIRSWGYELIKHDFTSYDIFGNWGFATNGTVCDFGNWSFYDKTKTSAEIVIDLYKLIKEAAKDTIILSCNTFSHLCAGLVEVNRIGDDTSGITWSRTRVMGVNSLAFRLPQNNAFYATDGDCVGIIKGNIPWKLNSQWLKLLSKCGAPIFVSADRSCLNEQMKREIKDAFKSGSAQKNIAIPLDWQYNNIPDKWEIDKEIIKFDFVMDYYPDLLFGITQKT